MKLIGVYDANGGITGEIAYGLGLLLGQSCALCKVTHTLLGGKQSFNALAQRHFVKQSFGGELVWDSQTSPNDWAADGETSAPSNEDPDGVAPATSLCLVAPVELPTTKWSSGTWGVCVFY